LQFGFDSRDGYNYIAIPSVQIPTGTNADFGGRWVFSTVIHYGRKFYVFIHLYRAIGN